MVQQARSRLIVLANRAPLTHGAAANGLHRTRSASGLVTALEPTVAAMGGTWIAHANGRVDLRVGGNRGGIRVTRGADSYRLRYVHLRDDMYRGYYDGFANQGLWPLCHATPVRPVFAADDYEAYRQANVRFVQAAVEEAAGAPLVLVQDYHFALAPRLLRERMPDAAVLTFWHVPWPLASIFGACPWAHELLEGLLASHIVGLQTLDDCRNFLDTVELLSEARVDRQTCTVRYRGRCTRVAAYPVGIEWSSAASRAVPSPDICRAEVCRTLGIPSTAALGVGVDRLDYTKGIHEKLLAIERLLCQRSDLKGRFAFVQVAEPSRDRLAPYRDVRARILETSERINRQFGTSACRPIHILESHHDAPDVIRLYRAADFCYVASLHDGMNLVAKEFVAARDDGRGVLILSRFAGAAQQLRAALIVNPCDIGAAARTIEQALRMPAAEQAKRLRLLRNPVKRYDASWWGRQLLTDLTLAIPERTLPSDDDRLLHSGPITRHLAPSAHRAGSAPHLAPSTVHSGTLHRAPGTAHRL